VPHGREFKQRHRNGGFSLFEMVVVICSIVILYMVAEQRLNQLPAAAERANFYAVLEQMKTGVNFEMVTRLASGRRDDIRSLEGSNPIDFLIEAPSNYRGELEHVTDTVEKRNSWYFETATGELVYVVGGSSIDDVKVTVGGVPVSLGQIRLKLTNVYDAPREPSDTSGSGRRDRDSNEQGSWQALQLLPVRPYTWDRSPEQPIPVGGGDRQ
jgi:hypothetical protein